MFKSIMDLIKTEYLREYQRQYQTEYYKNNREDIAEKNRIYYEIHKEDIAEKNRIYYEIHKEIKVLKEKKEKNIIIMNLNLIKVEQKFIRLFFD